MSYTSITILLIFVLVIVITLCCIICKCNCCVREYRRYIQQLVSPNLHQNNPIPVATGVIVHNMTENLEVITVE